MFAATIVKWDKGVAPALITNMPLQGAPCKHILRDEGLRAAMFQEHHPADGRRWRGSARAVPASKP